MKSLVTSVVIVCCLILLSSGSCVDKASYKLCSEGRNRGFCEGSGWNTQYIVKNCKKTCGFCDLHYVKPTISKISYPDGVCVNKDGDTFCSIRKQRGHCKQKKYITEMKRKCGKICEFCDSFVTAASKDPNCKYRFTKSIVARVPLPEGKQEIVVSFTTRSSTRRKDVGWFKLTFEGIGHVELKTDQREGNVYCKNARSQSWGNGAQYKFYMGLKADYYYRIVKTKNSKENSIKIFNSSGEKVYSKNFSWADGNCYDKTASFIKTQVWDDNVEYCLSV